MALVYGKAETHALDQRLEEALWNDEMRLTL